MELLEDFELDCKPKGQSRAPGCLGNPFKLNSGKRVAVE